MQKGKLRNNILRLGSMVCHWAPPKVNTILTRDIDLILTYQDEFKVSPDRETSDENRRMAQKSWNQMEDAKNYFIGMAASAVLTNLVTSIMLMFTSNHVQKALYHFTTLVILFLGCHQDPEYLLDFDRIESLQVMSLSLSMMLSLWPW